MKTIQRDPHVAVGRSEDDRSDRIPLAASWRTRASSLAILLVPVLSLLCGCSLFQAGVDTEIAHGSLGDDAFRDKARAAMASAIRGVTGENPLEDGVWLASPWIPGYGEDDCDEPSELYGWTWTAPQTLYRVCVRMESAGGGKSRLVAEASFRALFRITGTNDVERLISAKVDKGLGNATDSEPRPRSGWRECRSTKKLEKRLIARITDELSHAAEQ